MLRKRNLKSTLATGVLLTFVSAAACAATEATPTAAAPDSAASAGAASAVQVTPGTPTVKDPYLAQWLRLTPDRRPAVGREA